MATKKQEIMPICGVLLGGCCNIHSKTRENIQKPRGQSLVGFAHSGLPPRFLDILSRLFVNILQSTLANLHILLQFLRGLTSQAELRAVFVRPLCPQSYQERGGVLPNCSKSGKEKERRQEGTKRYFFWMRGERESSKAGMGNTWANAAAVVAAFF